LAQIENVLQPLHERGALNAINLYLYGVILKEKNKKEEAKSVFAESLTKCPLLWSAWLELGALITQGDDTRRVFSLLKAGASENHWMNNFYFANYYLDI
jgi:predicted Zn-dependent protease